MNGENGKETGGGGEVDRVSGYPQANMLKYVD